jgi:pimeloyl-ACP methyl ester carboxylesterase
VFLCLLGFGCVHLPPDVPDGDAPAGGRIAVPDGWLAGTTRGVAPGPPVVFVHGLGGNYHFFDPQLKGVEDRARVIAYDQRGCGGSSLAPRKKYDLGTLVHDLSVILDVVNVDQAILVGHSFGADVVSRYAGLHPDRVAALVLIDPPGDLRTELAALTAELAASDDAAFRAKVDALTERLLTGARPETRTAVLASVRQTPRDVLQRTIAGMGTFEPVSALAAYQGPLSCMVTDHTASRDPAARPCRTVVHLHGASHWPMLDEPDRVTQLIESAIPQKR